MAGEFSSQDEALAVAFANLKGANEKDLLRTARALAFLVAESGSQAATAEMVGVSREIVREFVSLLRLPPSVQDMIGSGELQTLEQGRRLAQLARYRPREVEAAAHEMVGLSAHDSRALSDYLIGHREVTPREARLVIAAAKDVVTREFHVIAILGEDEYQALRVLAEERGLSPDEMVSKIVRDAVIAGAPDEL